MSKFWRLLAPLLAAVLLLAACGASSHTTPTPTRVAQAAVCPLAADGHGQAGVCAPASVLRDAASRPHLAAAADASPQFEDLSNNDPCNCGPAIRAHGMSGLIVKANQGVGFIDWTAVPMVQSARAAGLAVGMYDFDQDYTVAEAQVFVARARAAGILPNTPNTFPLYLDVEYGNFNYGGLIAQIAYIRSQGYRVGIYTGDWYWGPHAGCQWPAGVTAWLSGYPSAIVPCGLPGLLFQAHQYTSTPVDISVFLGSTSQFTAFVASAPPPDPFLVFVDRTFQFGKDHANERRTARNWRRLHCLNPVLRESCKTTRAHLVDLLGREYFVAFHELQHGHWVTLKHARWGFPSNRQPLGSRAALIRADLRQR